MVLSILLPARSLMLCNILVRYLGGLGQGEHCCWLTMGPWPLLPCFCYQELLMHIKHFWCIFWVVIIIGKIAGKIMPQNQGIMLLNGKGELKLLISWPWAGDSIRALIWDRGRQESQYPIWKKDARSKNLRQPLETGKGKVTDFPVQFPEGTWACQYLDYSPM